jgi:hypothetical protein
MFVVFLLVLVIMVVIGGCSELVMRIRVTKMELHDKIAWWRRGGDEVESAYEELFPKSRLPGRFRAGYRGGCGHALSLPVEIKLTHYP